MPIVKNDPLDRENLYNENKEYYDKLYQERFDLLDLRPQLEIPQNIKTKLEEVIVHQNWRTGKLK